MSQLGSTVETQQITKFVDDVNIDSYEKPLMSSTSAWTRMAEDTKLHDIHAILSRPVNILDGEFKTEFNNISIKFPDKIFQSSANVVSKLDYFTFFRANVKVKLVFNATPFMSGKYWMFFAPFDAISNRPCDTAQLANVTGYPGIEIDLASNAPVEIKIPYCAPLSHYNLLDTHSNMGELFIVPLNAIQTGTSPVSQGATFTIFAWFEDIELAMPTSKKMTVPTEPEEDVVLRAQAGVEEMQKTSGPPISGVANAIAGAASSIGGAVPKLGSWVRPVEWIARAVGGAASAFGWNKPTNLDKNCPLTNIPAKGYTHADGIDLSTKLATMPDNGVTYDGGIFSTGVDEMDLKYVAAKSCIYKDAIPWKIDSAVGTVLHYAPVTPCITMASGQPTTLAFLSSMFRYWRGGLKYRLTVAKTAFHTGRLRITYNPGLYGDSANVAGTVYENAYNWILDLSVSSEIEFEIPYVSNVPWKECFLGAHNNAEFRKEKYTPGTITVTVLTQLRRASDSVANNAPINMWISGADDIAFAIPDFGSYVVYGTDTRSVQHQDDEMVLDDDEPGDEVLRAQVFNQTTSAIDHNEQMSDTASRTFPMSSMGMTTAEELTMGEKITNLRQLVKRFCPTASVLQYPYRERATGVAAYPGPVDLNNDQYLVNRCRIDPAYFGKKAEAVSTYQELKLPIARDAAGTISEKELAVMEYYPTQAPVHYISYLYRFFRGGKRYKLVSTENYTPRFDSSGEGMPQTESDQYPSYDVKIDTMQWTTGRPSQPLMVQRESLIHENGTIFAPTLGTFTSTMSKPLFEHLIYPDLNGVCEFEVPYYSQMPISLVGEATLDDKEGPLVKRAFVDIVRSHNPRGMDVPLTKPNGVAGTVFTGKDGLRPGIGGIEIYEAAADDFSFGYLIGAPFVKRVGGTV